MARIAAQMYTLRDFLQTPEQMPETFKKVKDMGYNAVQLSGLGPVDPKVLRDILVENELDVAATHNSMERFDSDIEGLIADHKLWNCKYAGIGSMGEEYRENVAAVKEFCRKINSYAKKLEQADMHFIYHNHWFEFARLPETDDRIIDIMLEECSDDVQFEVDTYWVQAGGADPAQMIRKVAGRVDVMHFKDMRVSMDKPEAIMAEVGEGNLNWPEILKACKEAGSKWYIVEQDTCQRHPMDSLAISLAHLKEWDLD